MKSEIVKKQQQGRKFLIIKNALYGLKEDIETYLKDQNSLIWNEWFENHEGITAYDDFQEKKIADLTVSFRFFINDSTLAISSFDKLSSMLGSF